MRFSLHNTIVSQRGLNRVVVLAVGLGFTLLMVSAIAAAILTVRTQAHSRWVTHTYAVQQAITEAYSQVLRLDAARRGYLLVGDPRSARAFVEARAALGPAIGRIQALSADNPVQQRNVRRLGELASRHARIVEASFRLASSGQRTEAARAYPTDGSLTLLLEVRAEVLRMQDEEHRLLEERERRQQKSIKRFYASVVVAALLLVIVALSSIILIIRYTRELNASRDVLGELNQNLEGAVTERTQDLQRANEEIQRFAYIVSHDLRSPLVNVMGFTAELEAAAKQLGGFVDRVEERAPELMDTDARLAAREDLPEAIGFIRTSTQKMDRLINAILRLSREGRRPITPERLDMDALFHSIADTMRHRTDELGISVTIASGMPAIVSDRVAVEQIFSNIIENATKYLKAGVAGMIAVDGTLERGRAVFSIADNGRGIDPRDHDRIFDLFRRSGQQDQPGEGIGLAHTRALAYRLGGTIVVDSRLGEGATFRVTLPTVYAGEQGAKS